MGRIRKDCPFADCNAKDLLRLPLHLSDVHKVYGKQKLLWLRKSKDNFIKHRPMIEHRQNVSTVMPEIRASRGNVSHASLEKEPFKLKHTFCMTISGPTACGKTTLMKHLLQSNGRRIDPPPQRILWLYKRWQPLYDVIQSTVYPEVDFFQGIPPDLDRDEFIDPSIRNLIIIDDLMSTASKDPRITDLFTEGSHHRNLSIIVLNQNLYYSKDPTQRRNCHYLVLFNNPIDKQQIMTLARQMYPEDSKYFMRHFQEAASHPFGYLLVDLKAQTPEGQRLRSNAFKGPEEPTEITRQQPAIMASQLEPSTQYVHQHDPDFQSFYSQEVIRRFPEDNIKGFEIIRRPAESIRSLEETTRNRGKTRHLKLDLLLDHICWCDDCGIVFCTLKDLERHRNDSCEQSISPQEATMSSCDICGSMFGSVFDLGKHVQQKHEGDDSDHEDLPVPWRKRPLESDDRIDEREMPNHKKQKKEEMIEFWHLYLRPLMMDEFQEKIDKKKEEYMEDGHTERVSRNMAINDFLKESRKSYRHYLTDFLIRLLRLDEDTLFKVIIPTVRRLQKQGKLDQDTAVREAVRLHKKMVGEHGLKERKGSELEDSDAEESEDKSEAEEIEEN